MGLNTREIALLIWAGIAISAILSKPILREHLRELWDSFTQRQIVRVLATFTLYVGLMVWLLYAIRVWDWDQLKNTVVWTFSVALVAIFRSNKIPDEPGYFRRWVADNFRILALIEFLVTLYTYPLWVELLVIPFVTLVSGMIAVGAHNPKVKSTVSFLSNVLAAFALGFFGLALYMTVIDFSAYATVQTWRDLYTPIVLTVLFLPFIFILYVTMSYETAFVGLPFIIQDKRQLRAAKWRAIVAFGTNVKLMQRWRRHIATHPPETIDDLKSGILEVRDAKRREEEKLPVPANAGWAPGIAKDFLSDFGLPAKDYHRSYDDEWSASSLTQEISDGVIPNNLTYRISGSATATTTLRLKLNVNEPATAQIAESQFRDLGEALIKVSTGNSNIVIGHDDFEEKVGTHHIRISTTEWLNGLAGGYDRILTVSI